MTRGPIVRPPRRIISFLGGRNSYLRGWGQLCAFPFRERRMSLTSSSPPSDDDERLDSPPVPWMHGAAGVMGGAFSMTLFYPLDLIRTRLHAAQTSRTRDGLRSIHAMVKENGVKSLFQGVRVAVLAHSIGWGTYLTLFRTVQQALARQYGSNSLGDFVAACAAAVTTAILVTPLNVLKTRAQLKSKSPDAASAAPLAAGTKIANPHTSGIDGKSKKSGVFRALRNIVKHEGAAGLFRGAGPQILLSMHTTIQVGLYEVIKRHMGWDHQNSPPPALGIAWASAASKAFASAVCNPLEVCRTRLQDRKNVNDPAYASMGTCFRTIYRNDGVKGLYRGVFVNVCRVVPTTVVAFVAYERCLRIVHFTSKFGTRGSLAAALQQ